MDAYDQWKLDYPSEWDQEPEEKTIDTDLGIEYQDSGPWRSYRITASGNSVKEMIDDATVEEIDQDGGELDCYGLDDAPREVSDAAEKLIKKEFE